MNFNNNVNISKKFLLIVGIIFFLFFNKVVVASVDELKLKLPFPAGEEWHISQGYNCEGWNSPECTHKITKYVDDLYAIDFNFGEGNDDYGKSILAAGNGTAYLRKQWCKNKEGEYYICGYGQYIDIDHGNGLISRYAHLLSYSVKDGEYVKQGQEIGKCDNTGYNGGSHLHFALYKGKIDIQNKKTLVDKSVPPEPMSGYTNFLAGNWYVSDNEVYDPNRVLAQMGGQQNNNQNVNLPWWQKVVGAVTSFWQKLTQPVIHFVINRSEKSEFNSNDSNVKNTESNIENPIWSAEMVSQSNRNLMVKAGEVVSLSATFKNNGNQTWTSTNNVSLNIANSDASQLYHSSWLTKKRPVLVSKNIEPGQLETFNFQIQIPNDFDGQLAPSFYLVYSDSSGWHSLAEVFWQITVEKSFVNLSESANDNQDSNQQENQPSSDGSSSFEEVIPNNSSQASGSSSGQEQTPSDSGGSGGGSSGGMGGGVGGGSVDNTPPETIINNLDNLPLITNQNLITFQFSSNEPDSVFQCRLDSQEWENCSSPKTYSNLSEGNHLFQVRAIDLSQNVDQTPAQFSWKIDLTSPISIIDSSFENSFFNLNSWPGKIFGTASTNDLEKVEIQIQKGLNSQYLGFNSSSTLEWLDQVQWLTANLDKDNNWHFDLPVSLLSDENYIIRSRAIDSLGNRQETISESQFIFDQTPPSKPENLEINFNSVNSEINLSWDEADDNLSGIDYYQINWQINDQEFTTSTTQKFFSLPGEIGQNYLFQVRAVDKAGNTSQWLEKEYLPQLPLSGWSKRKVFVIDNKENRNDLENFEVDLEINYQEEMNPDFSDIRFTDSDGQTLLNYGWDIKDDGNEDKEDGVRAKAVVQIPFIPKYSEKIIYLYYGNQSAEPVANLKNVLIWFDHFDSNSENRYNQQCAGFLPNESRVILGAGRWPDPWVCGCECRTSWLALKDFSIKNFWLKARIARGNGWSASTRFSWRNQWWLEASTFSPISYGFSQDTLGNSGDKIWDGNWNLMEIKSYQTRHTLKFGDLFLIQETSSQGLEEGGISFSDLWSWPGYRRSWMWTAIDFLYIRPYTLPMPTVFEANENYQPITLPEPVDPYPQMPGWQKRKEIIIDNTLNSEDLNDFEINFHLDYLPEMNPDFSDIRFTDSDGQTLLDYGWDINNDGTEKIKDGVFAEAVVKIPFIPANSEKRIYLYYQNQEAIAVANLEKTLTWFDHFKTNLSEGYEIEGDFQLGWFSDRSLGNLHAAKTADGRLFIKDKLIKNSLMRTRITGKMGNNWPFGINAFVYHRYLDENNHFVLSRYIWQYYWDKGGESWLDWNSGPIGTHWRNYQIIDFNQKHQLIAQNDDGSLSFSVEREKEELNQEGKIGFGAKWSGTFYDGQWAVFDYLYLRKYTEPMPLARFGD